MQRADFHKLFKTPGPVVLPVIHALDDAQAEANIRLAISEGAPGVFLINHDFEYQRLLPIIKAMRERFPTLWLGVNFLAVSGKEAFPVLAQLAAEGCIVDAYWADDARIDEQTTTGHQIEAQAIEKIRAGCAWGGLYFGGTAFKKQRPVAADDYRGAAQIAGQYMDAVTTSGSATGRAADLAKITEISRRLRRRRAGAGLGRDPG